MQKQEQIEKVLEKLNEIIWKKIYGQQYQLTLIKKLKIIYLMKRLINKELLANIYEIGYAPWDYTDILIEMVENGDITFRGN